VKMNELNKRLDARGQRPVVWPRLECADGFSVSVQASRNHYSLPRKDAGPYDAVELGYPSAPMGEQFSDYAEDEDRLTDTVYGYVPTELVVALVKEHGGCK
jgi:hypothetical protein